MDLILNGNIPISGNKYKLELDLKCLANILTEKGFNVYICRDKHLFRDGGVVLSSSNQRGLETNLRQIFYSSDWLIPFKFKNLAKPIGTKSIFDVIIPSYSSFPEITKIINTSNFKSCSFSKIGEEIKNHRTFSYKPDIWEEICSSKIGLIYRDNWHTLGESLWLKTKCVFLNCPKMMETIESAIEVKSSYDLEMVLSSKIKLVEIPEEINRNFILNLENLIVSLTRF